MTGTDENGGDLAYPPCPHCGCEDVEIIGAQEPEPSADEMIDSSIIYGCCTGCDLPLTIRRNALATGNWVMVDQNTVLLAPSSMDEVKSRFSPEQWAEIERLRSELE